MECATSPASRIWPEVKGLVEECPWFKVYDIIEALHASFAQSDENTGDNNAVFFANEINEFFVDEGIGWQLVGGQIMIRGTEAFEARFLRQAWWPFKPKVSLKTMRRTIIITALCGGILVGSVVGGSYMIATAIVQRQQRAYARPARYIVAVRGARFAVNASLSVFSMAPSTETWGAEARC
jgi:hypothetical protein